MITCIVPFVVYIGYIMSSHSNRFPALHLEIFTDRRGTTPYHYGLFRSSFRKDGKVKHRTYGRVTGLPLRSLQALRDFVRRGCPGGDLGVTCVTKSARELGACRAVLELVEELGPLETLHMAHTHAPQRAAALLEMGRHLFPDNHAAMCVEVAPVMGVHFGPGAVGFLAVKKA